jgi:alkylation response protein AidB-like acyl-CoA dehydrogenase
MGGLDGGPIETMVIMEELGRGLVVEPYLPTIVLCGGILSRHASDAQKEAHLPGIIGGEDVWALAYAEPQSRFNPADVLTSAKADGDGYVLNGTKAVVAAAPWASKLIVSARISGDQRDSDGLGLFIVEKSASGVSTQDYPTVDGNRASEVTLENVTVGADALIGGAGNGLALLDEALDYGIGAVCAEAIGHMKCLNDATVEYCKTRKQFGVPIGSFQVLQHRMVDMFMEYEQSVSMTYMVNMKLTESEAERKKAAAGAKVQIGKSGRFVGQEAVQLHGGMGMTEELNVGHYFKRLTVIDTQFGNVDHHLKRFAAA